jgi:hypothetical protein
MSQYYHIQLSSNFSMMHRHELRNELTSHGMRLSALPAAFQQSQ